MPDTRPEPRSASGLLQQEPADRAAPLVRRPARIGGEPPMRLELRAAEEAHGDLGVADVERQEHGGRSAVAVRSAPGDGSRRVSSPSVVCPRGAPAARRRPRFRPPRPAQAPRPGVPGASPAGEPRPLHAGKRAGGGVHRANSGDHGLDQVAVTVGSAAPRQGGVRPRSAGGGAMPTLRPTPMTTQASVPPCQRASHKSPPALRSSSIRSLGHLSPTRLPPSSRPARPRRRARAQAQELEARRGRRARTLSQSPPGATTSAPARPRPLTCSSATSAVPAGAPSCAKSWTASIVEPARSTRRRAGRARSSEEQQDHGAERDPIPANAPKLCRDTYPRNACTTMTALTNGPQKPTAKAGRSAAPARPGS